MNEIDVNRSSLSFRFGDDVMVVVFEKFACDKIGLILRQEKPLRDGRPQGKPVDRSASSGTGQSR